MCTDQRVNQGTDELNRTASEYNLLDVENIYYIEGKRLLLSGDIDKFEYFITSIATLDTPFNLFGWLDSKDDRTNLESMFDGNPTCVPDIVTDILEWQMFVIVHRMKIGDLNSLSLDY